MSATRKTSTRIAIACLAASVALAAACSAGGGAPRSPTPASTAAPTSSPSIAAQPPTSSPSTAAASTPQPAAGPAVAVYRANPARRAVALTFDAGADAGFTPGILDTLRREGVRASFGVTGLWAEQNRDLLLAIAADGHTFINHTYDHASFTGRSTQQPPLTAAERSLELSRTETTVYHLAGRTTRPYFRPPYGDIDAGVLHDAGAAGYDTVVMWTVDTLGWDGRSADDIVARCLAMAEPGAIYVMHVGAQSQDAAALPRVIDELRAAGYAFATIDEILR